MFFSFRIMACAMVCAFLVNAIPTRRLRATTSDIPPVPLGMSFGDVLFESGLNRVFEHFSMIDDSEPIEIYQDFNDALFGQVQDERVAELTPKRFRVTFTEISKLISSAAPERTNFDQKRFFFVHKISFFSTKFFLDQKNFVSTKKMTIFFSTKNIFLTFFFELIEGFGSNIYSFSTSMARRVTEFQ